MPKGVMVDTKYPNLRAVLDPRFSELSDGELQEALEAGLAAFGVAEEDFDEIFGKLGYALSAAIASRDSGDPAAAWRALPTDRQGEIAGDTEKTTSFEPPAVPGLGLVLAAAASVGQLGALTTPPGQFATPGLAVTHVATGIYRVTFPGYAPDGRYLVTGIARNELREPPRQIEHLVRGAADVFPSIDESLGLYVRIWTLNGSAIDSAFEIQIYSVGD